MPRVPVASENPTVEGRIAPPTYQTPTDNSAAFGAGVGQAEQALGTATQQAGDIGNKIATDLGVQADIRASKDADTAHMNYVNTLAFKGDGTAANPNGYYAMKGEQALAYAPVFQQAIQDNAKDTAAGLSARASNMFLGSAQARNVDVMAKSMAFSMQQNQEANITSSNGRMAAAASSAVNTWNDPAATENAAQIIRGETTTQMAGQPQEAINAAVQARTSKLYEQNIYMALGAGDITTASKLFNLYGPTMDPATHVQVQEKMHGPVLTATATAAVNAALGRSTTIGDGSTPITGGVADKTLPPEQQAFLNTLSGPESAGKYNVRYTPNGGATFNDLSHHPNIPEPGPAGPSTAAGRYQFTNSTWQPIAAKLGLNDFSPASQDKGAIDLASTTYNAATGRDLPADLKEGGHAAEIAGALNKVWPSLPGGSQAGTTLAKFTAGLSQTESGPTATSVAAATAVHPDFSAAADKLAAQFGSDPELLNKSMSVLRQQEGIYNLGVKTQQEALNKTFNDTAAALADGRDVPIPELAIRHAFDLDVANQRVDKLKELRQFGQTYKQVQFMAPADYQAAREVLASTLGAKAATGTDVKGQVTPGNTDIGQTPDFTHKYNTSLTVAEQGKYQEWLKTLPENQRNTFDYDMQGAWKAGLGQSGNGHFPDDYKKPNHPTFSNQSVYDGVDGYQGGKWGDNDSFTASATNVAMHGAQGLTAYFHRVEPDSQLNMPQASGDVTGYAQRSKELATLDAAWKQRTDRLTADPASYTRTAPSVAAAYAAIDPKDPATIETAVNASKAAQVSMGVDPADTRTLTNATVGDLVKKLHSVDPKDGDMGAQLDAMAKQYGGAWPGVMHDLVTQGKLNPAYQMLGAMDDPTQAGARQNLQRALQDQANKGDKFGSAVPALQKQPLEQGIEGYLSDFRASTVNGGGAMFTGVVMPAVKTLATYYAEQGQESDTAAKMAVDQIVNSKYEFSGATRVPKTFDGKPLGINTVLDAGNALKENLKDGDLTGFTAKEARQGIWAPNPDEQGVTLLARKTNGFGYQMVKSVDGKPISMSFGNLPTAMGPLVNATPDMQ